MTKFAKFIEENKIDPRRLVSASVQLECLTREDRLFRAAATRKHGLLPKKDESKIERRKSRSGRPLAMPTLEAARAGKVISGPAKTRVLRAVNHILSQRKKDAVDLRALF